MKVHNILLYLCSVCIVSTTSCSTVNSLLGKTSQEVKQANNTPKKSDSKSKKRGRNSVVTQLSPATAQTTSELKTFSEADSIATLQLLEGEWYFENINDIKVSGEEDRPTLHFEATSSRFYASNGCNFFNGNYCLKGSTALVFDNILSTSNLCEDIPWANSIAALWPNVHYFNTFTKNKEQYLELRNSNNKTIATLKRHTMAMANGLWNVTSINGRRINSNFPTIVIDLIEHRIHGNTGCNLVNGTIYQDPDTEMSIEFQNMAVTRMSCPDIAIETSLLVGLEQVEKAIIESSDTIILTDTNNKHLIVLTRAVI